MCGICGIVHFDPNHQIDRSLIERMNSRMLHRGPDGEGFYVKGEVGLAMRRLSIIDLKDGGQPHFSEDEKIVSVCNGEIYNFEELKKELEGKGHIFKSRTDAEVLPHLYEEYGNNFVERLYGMFGLAIWDGKNKVLILARDRMGKKPLYWSKQSGSIIFASELKAILSHPKISPNVNRLALAKYLAYEYVPAPLSIISGVNKLEAGHLLICKGGDIAIKKYWDIPIGQENNAIGEDDAVDFLTFLITKAVKRRLKSDVPLGVFLSGGVDSSSIAYFASKLLPPGRLKTFSMGFEEKSFDESNFARSVAGLLGTEHHEEFCTPDSLIGLLDETDRFLDEPLGDASIIPTYALSKFTKQHVTVALSGDGGDELFAGYPTFQAEKLLGYYLMLPSFLRNKIIAPVINSLPVSDENISFDFRLKQFLKGANVSGPKRHIYWMGSFLPEELNSILLERVDEDPLEDVTRHFNNSSGSDEGNRLLYIYKKLYLQDDILAKVDRASMGVSLECRSPFMDHDVVEYVARLPYSFKLRGFVMKHLLKKTMTGFLPPEVIGRSKKGFGIPVAKWLKGPLKGRLLDCLSPSRIKRNGFFDANNISKLIDDHMNNRVDNRKKLWTLLVFDIWKEELANGKKSN